MLEDYDFSSGVRGKYAERYKAGTNIVRLDEDVAAIFSTSQEVNAALRSLGEIIRQYGSIRVSKSSGGSAK